MTKAIIFDFFGVLVTDYTRELMDRTSDEAIKQAIADADRANDLGYISDDELIAEVAAIAGVDEAEVRDQVMNQIRLNSDMLELVKRARKHYKTALLSNAGHTSLDPYWSEHERQAYFDQIIISAEVGLVKPDPRIFELACERLDIQPAEAFFIDDIERNVEAAQSVGLQAVVFESATQIAQAMENLR